MTQAQHLMSGLARTWTGGFRSVLMLLARQLQQSSSCKEQHAYMWGSRLCLATE